MITFKAMTEKQSIAHKDAVSTIRKNETSTVRLIDKHMPIALNHAWSGSHPGPIASIRNATHSTRRKSLDKVIKAFAPNQFDEEKGTFGKRYSGKKLEKREEEYQVFLASGMTITQWIDQNVTVESKPVDHVAKIITEMKKARKNGATDKDILTAIVRDPDGLSFETICNLLGLGVAESA